MKNFVIEFVIHHYGTYQTWHAVQAEDEAGAVAAFKDWFSFAYPAPPAYVVNGKTATYAVKAMRPMTLADYWDQLHAHDWYYAMSDDHGVWLAGERAINKLRALAKIGGSDWETLLTAFSKHYFSGPPWGTEQVSLPERPV
jgi:hypothetical protein